MVLSYGSLLSYGSETGTLFSNQCTYFSSFVLAGTYSMTLFILDIFTALQAFIYGILHIFLMILAFDGFRQLALCDL